MTANELADKLHLYGNGYEFQRLVEQAEQELRTLSSANKWQADRLGKLEALNSWQASEINLFSADLKKSIVELHADSEIALLFSTEQLQQANARIAELHAENEKLNAYANENRANWNYWQLEADKFRLELQRANTSYQDLRTKFGQLYDERYEGCGEHDGETYEQIHAELDTANARIADFEKELFEIGCIVENLQMKLQLRNMSIGLLEKEGNNKTLCIRSLIKLQDILVVKLSQYESIIKLAEVK